MCTYDKILNIEYQKDVLKNASLYSCRTLQTYLTRFFFRRVILFFSASGNILDILTCLRHNNIGGIHRIKYTQDSAVWSIICTIFMIYSPTNTYKLFTNNN